MKSIVKSIVVLLVIVGSHSICKANSINGLSNIWFLFSNPVETLFFNKNTERQHCTPQSRGGSHITTVTWTRSNHSVSDRWKSRPFLDDNTPWSFLTFGNEESMTHLDAASRMGRYGIPYSLIFYHYNKAELRPVCMVFDGPSMLVYGWSWLINIPGKFFNQLAYTIQVGTEPSLWYLLDFITMAIMGLIDIITCLFMTVVGFVIGCICNPIDSFCAIPGAIYYLLADTIYSFWWLFLGMIRLLPFI